MQRINNLFPAFCSFRNLLSAWRKTRKGSGPCTESALFGMNLEKELFALQTELQQGVWRPRPFRFFDIYDPKHRTIAVSDFRDRVIHHALVNVLEPIYEKVFITDSFATRKGKGVHAAVFRAQQFLHQHEFYLKTDIEKFFDSVPHDALLDIIARKIKDTRLLDVCEKIVRHGGVLISNTPEYNKSLVGLPIGNRTSQFFANVCLDPLDHFLKDHCQLHGYVRYMDDFVLFGHDKQQLKDLKAATEAFIWDNIKLRLKPSATFLNRRQNGLPFLGRRIFPNIIRLRTENLRRITRRIELRERQRYEGDLTDEEFLQSMNSYWAMLSYYPELKPLRLALLNT